MNNKFIKVFCTVIALLFSANTFASSTIKVTVKTKYNVTGLGFSVDGHDKGGLGREYTAKGPLGKRYSFGFRKGVFASSNVSCGSMVLNKDSIVHLITDGKTCHPELRTS